MLPWLLTIPNRIIYAHIISVSKKVCKTWCGSSVYPTCFLEKTSFEEYAMKGCKTLLNSFQVFSFPTCSLVVGYWRPVCLLSLQAQWTGFCIKCWLLFGSEAFKTVHLYVMAIPVQTLCPVSIVRPLELTIVPQEVSWEIHHFTSSTVHWFKNGCFFPRSNLISVTIGILQGPVGENICTHFSGSTEHPKKTLFHECSWCFLHPLIPPSEMDSNPSSSQLRAQGNDSWYLYTSYPHLQVSE